MSGAMKSKMMWSCGKEANKIGKGSNIRPRQVSREELELRWKYAEEKISLATFNRRLKKIRKQKNGNDISTPALYKNAQAKCVADIVYAGPSLHKLKGVSDVL